MPNISPSHEPVAWGAVIGLVLAALASYGLNITPQLKDALVVVVPVLITAVIARSQVTPVAKLEGK